MTVVVVDYGVGNLHSVVKAIEHEGGSVLVTSNPDEVRDAERLVLPGVGAFGDGMRELRQRNLVEPILRFAETRRPLLGICLGMQLLLSESLEFGVHQGLGIIEGKVVPIAPREGMKVPQIGWNHISPPNGVTWDGTRVAANRVGAICEEISREGAVGHATEGARHLPPAARRVAARHQRRGCGGRVAVRGGRLRTMDLHDQVHRVSAAEAAARASVGSDPCGRSSAPDRA